MDNFQKVTRCIKWVVKIILRHAFHKLCDGAIAQPRKITRQQQAIVVFLVHFNEAHALKLFEQGNALISSNREVFEHVFEWPKVHHADGQHEQFFVACKLLFTFVRQLVDQVFAGWGFLKQIDQMDVEVLRNFI